MALQKQELRNRMRDAGLLDRKQPEKRTRRLVRAWLKPVFTLR